ncbi:glycosyltransferase [Candidatus Peregrinibacteria bacterium]|jgi:glycosyltransferase involved in cell wall biosynthesis|nr:glycosyltransferase [Candidatus Peregrinibacteria bacterium]MBT7337193.1 glycosyltransferase [Candidatus Peregrinibacteria bacterium]
MNIAYVTHTRFPTEKAHGHQIARVCDALEHLKNEVTLVTPSIFTDIRQDPKRYYHLKSDIDMAYLPIFDALSSSFIPGKFAFHFTMHSYRRALKKYFASHTFDLIYVRSPAVLPTLLETGIPVVIELHTLPKRNQKSFAAECNRCKKVVCLTGPMRKELITFGVKKAKIIVEGDAVDLDRFKKLPSAKSARHHFNLPDDRKIIGYVGSFVTMDKIEKGLQFIIDSLVVMRKNDEQVHGFFVGGPLEWAQKYRKIALAKGLREDDFTFHGMVPSKLVPDAIAACDVCVYPAPEPKKAFFARDTSPLKVFEYLAAGRPVVSADIPPLHGVLTKETVKLVHPGSVTSLTGGIREVLAKKSEAKARTARGLKLVQKHSWEKRMKRILDAL